MYVRMRIFLSRPNRIGETLKLYIYLESFTTCRRRETFDKNPVFEEVTGRFVKFGGVVHF